MGKLIKLVDAAKMIGVCKETLRKRVKEGKIVFIKTKSGRFFIEESVIEDIISNGTILENNKGSIGKFKKLIEEKHPGAYLMPGQFYQGNKWKAKIFCDVEEHGIFEMSYNSVQRGQWCRKCGYKKMALNQTKYNLDYFQSLIDEKHNGAKLIRNKIYKNVGQNHDIKCEEGHEFKISIDKLKRGDWCKFCSGNLKKSIEDFENLLEKKHHGSILIDNEIYVGGQTKHLILCEKDHLFETCWSYVNSGYWCPFCAKRDKKSLYDFEKIIKELHPGAKIIESLPLKNSRQKCRILCEKKHKFWTNYDRVNKGHWCPSCVNRRKQQNEFSSLISKNGFNIETEVSGLLENKRFRFDCYIKEIKTAIEYDGSYWHSKLKNNGRDFLKEKQSLENGLNLIRVKDKLFIKAKNETINFVVGILKIIQKNFFEENFVLKISKSRGNKPRIKILTLKDYTNKKEIKNAA